VAALLMTGLAGCSGLLPKTAPLPSFYTLDGAQMPAAASPIGPQGAASSASTPTAAGPTLAVGPPHAAAGFDSPRIIYTREAHQLAYFAHSEWVDTPARMLTPLIVTAVARSSALRAVVLTPSIAAADIRLDTELVRLQQDFGDPPSRVRFTLRATLVDTTTHRVLASREFDQTEVSLSEDAYGGVLAAHRVVQRVLGQLASLCDEAASRWRPTEAGTRGQ
jgi:cholesterol transport system auxiliary component